MYPILPAPAPPVKISPSRPLLPRL